MMNNTEIRVGIIGLGKISQTKYIPALHRHSYANIVGLCDKSRSLSEKIAEYYGYGKDCIAASIEELIAKNPHLVFILTHDHYNVAKALLNSGISVCVEKPLCWSSAQAEELYALAQEKGASLYACYMKQFDPAFVAFRERIAESGLPLMINISCFAGNNKKWCDPLYKIIKENADEKSDAKQELKKAWDKFYSEDCTGKQQDRSNSQLLLQLGIHQINLLHALVDDIDIDSFTAIDDNGVRKIFCTGMSEKLRINYTLIPLFNAPWVWKEKFEALYSDKVLEYEPGCPFLISADSTLRVCQGNDMMENSVYRFGYEDYFYTMIDHILNTFEQGVTPDYRCSAESAIKDIRFIETMLME